MFVIMQITDLCDDEEPACSLIDIYERFAGWDSVRLQCRNFEVNVYQTARRHVPEDCVDPHTEQTRRLLYGEWLQLGSLSVEHRKQYIGLLCWTCNNISECETAFIFKVGQKERYSARPHIAGDSDLQMF
jgi:hypothetical protein